VSGVVLRPFSYGADPFAGGWHRGVDLRAAPGNPVRAACGGRVVTALAGAVVTLRCGLWRVTHLPMAGVAVYVGQRVAAGARIGTLGTGRGHRGLHLGVRRADDPFGYVDPLAFLRAARPPAVPPPVAAPPRRAPPPTVVSAPRLLRPLRTPARSRPLARAPRLIRPLGTPARARPFGRAPHLVRPLRTPSAAQPVGVRVPPAGEPAPWPVWVGLALVLFGACGGGVRWRLRARRVPGRARVREAVR
jgi:peptidase M23-like protein